MKKINFEENVNCIQQVKDEVKNMEFCLNGEKTVNVLNENGNYVKGKELYLTTASENIEMLRKASEKYGVEIPDAEFHVLYYAGEYDIHYRIDDEVCTESSFSLSEVEALLGRELSIDRMDESNAVKNAIEIIETYLYLMNFEESLQQYLYFTKGIYFEEDCLEQ